MKMVKYDFNKYVGKIVGQGAIALLLAAGLLTACETTNEADVQTPTEPSETSVEQPTSTTGEQNVQVGDLTGNLEDYVGQAVSVRGDMDEPIGDAAFTLQGDRLFSGEDVVVINATGAPFLVPDGEQFTKQIQVTGQVRQFAIAQLQDEYGLTLDPETYEQYEDNPVIIAESIAFAPEPSEISENPESYYGQTIAVEGEIAEQLSPDTITLQDDELFSGEELLVAGVTPGAELAKQEKVVVTGVLRPYIATEFERDYDFNWDTGVQQRIEEEYAERPVLVLEEIFPSAR